MKTKITLLLLALVLGGCMSINPERHLKTISQWIPPGTPEEDAIRIMKQHGYECGPTGRNRSLPDDESVFCFWHETKILKNTRSFFVHFKNGQVDSIDGWITGNDLFIGHVDKSGA